MADHQARTEQVKADKKKSLQIPEEQRNRRVVGKKYKRDNAWHLDFCVC